MCKEQGSETNKIIKKDRLKSHQSEQVSHANSKNNFKSSNNKTNPTANAAIATPIET